MSESYNIMKGPIKILLIEDNVDIQEATCLIFELHWPEARVIQAFKGGEGIALMRVESPDVIILDLGLPDMDGMKVLREIRRFSNIPIIILTVRGEEMDKVRGLELGADDYIVKPFEHEELLVRLGAVLHRQQSEGAPEAGHVSSTKIGIDLENGTVSRDGQPVNLTNTEVNLLKYLVSHEGETLSEMDILNRIWGEEYTDCSEYLQAYIRRLREKLEDNPNNPQLIVKEDDGFKFVQQAA